MATTESILTLVPACSYAHIRGDVDAMNRLVEQGYVSGVSAWAPMTVPRLIAAWEAYAAELQGLKAALKKEAEGLTEGKFTWAGDKLAEFTSYRGVNYQLVRKHEEALGMVKHTYSKVQSEWLSVSKLKNIVWLINEVALKGVAA